MTKDQVTAVLKRVRNWPPERQQELAELALEIEAGLADPEYQASEDELKAIDEAFDAETANDAEVKAAFAALRRA